MSLGQCRFSAVLLMHSSPRTSGFDRWQLGAAGLHSLSLRQNLLTDASQVDQSASKAGQGGSVPPSGPPPGPGCSSMMTHVCAGLRELILHDNQLDQVTHGGVPALKVGEWGVIAEMQ